MSYYISSERMGVIWLINRKVRSEDILVTMSSNPLNTVSYPPSTDVQALIHGLTYLQHFLVHKHDRSFPR